MKNKEMMNSTTINPTFETLQLSIPPEDIKFIKALAKKFGWKLGKKKSGLKESIDDIKKGRVYEIKDIDAYFKKLGVE